MLKKWVMLILVLGVVSACATSAARPTSTLSEPCTDCSASTTRVVGLA